jgi:DNA-binding transcriptional MerR regulator
LDRIRELKSLGFRLEDIKDRIPALDAPDQVASLLAEQADNLQAQIDSLTESLAALRTLREQVLQMQVVDFDRYATIIKLSRSRNADVWLVKHLPDRMLDRLRSIGNTQEVVARIEAAQNQAIGRAVNLQAAGVPPESEIAMEIVGQPWGQSVLDYTGGDLSLLPELAKFRNSAATGAEWEERYRGVEQYLNAAMAAYLLKAGTLGELDPSLLAQLAPLMGPTEPDPAEPDPDEFV